MKVLFVASGNKSNSSDKPGTVVFNQANSLKSYGVDISYFLIRGGGAFSYISSIIPLCKRLKMNKYDIIHSHYSLSSFVVTLARFIAGQNKMPQVVSLMGSDTKLSGLNKVLVRVFSKHSWSATIVKTKSMLNGLSLGMSYIIPNGVDLTSVSFMPERKENLANKVILFAADPSRESKNYTLAEKACSLLVGTNSTLKVVYNVSHKHIIEEINKSDVLLLTSKWEGSPNLIKEAMACNCPVVATNVGDIEWLFGDEPGHFLTTFDPEDVADKIKKALEFSVKYGCTNGRERITKLGLDAESIAKRITFIYKSVLKDGC